MFVESVKIQKLDIYTTSIGRKHNAQLLINEVALTNQTKRSANDQAKESSCTYNEKQTELELISRQNSVTSLTRPLHTEEQQL